MQADIRPGMLVNMRRRLWRVESLEGGVLTATPVDDFGAPRQRFLAEIERIEPGRLEDPSVEVPGDPELHKLFLRALRLDAIHGTAPFLSLQRISVVPDEYQLVPLIMALRQQPVRMLIADTIGTGKTIEAGIIIKELLARNQARSVLIIVPAVLREQWREQMRDLFYLDFEIISSDTRKRLERSIPPGADPWHYFDRLIVSADYAKASHVRQDVLKRKWDIVVVDEAHNAAMPHSGTGRKADMERWELVRDVARHASCHLLLLTATPHNGYTDSFCSLLEMLSRRLVVGSGPDVRPNKEIGIAHVCQRTRDNIQDWFKEIGRRYPFPEREPQAETEVPVKLHSEYIGILSELEKVLDLVEAHARVMKKDQPIQWLRLHLFRRALSSPEALEISLRNRLQKLSPESPEQEQMELEDEQEENLALASLTDRGADDADTEDETDRRVDSIALHIDRELQRKYFGDILQTLEKLDSSKDRKLAELRDRVIPSLFAKAGDNIPARIIVFTRYKDTLNYLERELSQNGDYQVFTLHGICPKPYGNRDLQSSRSRTKQSS
jgi:superfamily II DNA or RNA helicase